MNDEQMQPLLEVWLREREIPRPHVQTGVARVMADVPRTRQQGRWWPLPVSRPKAQTATATDTGEYRPSPIPATNGHAPTVIGRTQSMFSPVKAIVAGALVFALGGAFLIAQPFERQGSVPGVEQGAAPADSAPDVPHQFSGPCTYAGASSVAYGEEDGRFLQQLEDGRFPHREQSRAICEMDDARLSGTLYQLWNHEGIGGPKFGADGEVLAGTVELVNDDGSWVGTTRGYIVNGPPRTLYWQHELTGTGAYDGYSALAYAVGEGMGDHEFEGFVFPGELPEYPYPVEVPAQ